MVPGISRFLTHRLKETYCLKKTYFLEDADERTDQIPAEQRRVGGVPMIFHYRVD